MATCLNRRDGEAGRGGNSHQVVLGKLGKVHGTRGWLILQSYTEPAANVLNYPVLQAEVSGQPRSLRMDASSWHQDRLLVHMQGVDDPEAARLLTGAEVWVGNSALPPLAQGEFYWHELQGMLVYNLQGSLLGRVRKLLSTGANDVLVVRAERGSIDHRERLIPYVKGVVVRDVDKGLGHITVDWDASYLE